MNHCLEKLTMLRPVAYTCSLEKQYEEVSALPVIFQVDSSVIAGSEVFLLFDNCKFHFFSSKLKQDIPGKSAILSDFRCR